MLPPSLVRPEKLVSTGEASVADYERTLGELGDEVLSDGLELGGIDGEDLLDLTDRLHGVLGNIGLRPCAAH